MHQEIRPLDSVENSKKNKKRKRKRKRKMKDRVCGGACLLGVLQLRV